MVSVRYVYRHFLSFCALHVRLSNNHPVCTTTALREHTGKNADNHCLVYHILRILKYILIVDGAVQLSRPDENRINWFNRIDLILGAKSRKDTQSRHPLGV